MQSTPQNIKPSTLLFVVPEEEWRNLHATLEQIIDLITRRNADDSSSEWIESEAARKLLGISPKTWQNYRDQRLIPFSQIGRKIYVNRTDLDAFLRSYRVGSKTWTTENFSKLDEFYSLREQSVRKLLLTLQRQPISEHWNWWSQTNFDSRPTCVGCHSFKKKNDNPMVYFITVVDWFIIVVMNVIFKMTRIKTKKIVLAHQFQFAFLLWRIQT